MNSKNLLWIGIGVLVVVAITITVVVVQQKSPPGPPAPTAPTPMSEQDQRAIEEGERLRRAAAKPEPPKGKLVDPFPQAHSSTTQSK